MQERGKVIFVAIVLLISLAIEGYNSVNSAETIKAEQKSFPDHPITLIVPFGAGGTMDLQARMLETKSQQLLGEPMVVVNKPGGAGILAWNELGYSAPDGYTLAISGIELLLHPLIAETRFRYPTALDPLAQISSAPLIMVVNARSSWQTVDDLVQYAKQHPYSIKLAHSGIGSIGHILGKILAMKAGVKFEEVPFRGGSESVGALLGNHVQVIIVSPASVIDQIRAGRLRAVALTSEERSNDPVFMQVPTFKELGYDIVLDNWIGVCAVKVLPNNVKKKLAENLKRMILDPEFEKGVKAMGSQVEYLSAEESKIRWRNAAENLRKMVEETGVLEQVREQKGLNE